MSTVSSVIEITNKLAALHADLYGIRADFATFSEELTGRITSVGKGLESLAALVQALPQPEAMAASAMSASSSSSSGGTSDKVQKCKTKALPTPPETGGKPAAHPAEALIAQAKKSCGQKQFRQSAEELAAAEAELTKKPQPEMSLELTECRKALHAKFQSAMRVFITGGTEKTAVGYLLEVEGLIDPSVLHPFFLMIAEQQLQPVREGNFNLEKKLEIVFQMCESPSSVIKQQALQTLSGICANYSGVDHAIVKIRGVKEKLPQGPEKKALIGFICDGVRRDVEQKMSEDPLNTIQFVNGLLTKWPENWPSNGFGEVAYAEASMRGYAKEQLHSLVQSWFESARTFLERADWGKARGAVRSLLEQLPDDDDVKAQADRLLQEIAENEKEERAEFATQQAALEQRTTSSPPKSPPTSSPPRSSSPEGAREGGAAAATSSSSSSSSASVSAGNLEEEATMDPVKFNADLELAKTKMRTPVGRTQAEAILRRLLRENLDNDQRRRLEEAIKAYNAKWTWSKIELS